MAKYLLSYDEQDVKNGNLDVSPDGVLKSAGKSGSDEPVLPQKVLFTETDSEGNTLCCGRKCSEMTKEEALALCLQTMPFLFGGENFLVLGAVLTSTYLVANGMWPASSAGGCGDYDYSIRGYSPDESPRIPVSAFKQS